MTKTNNSVTKKQRHPPMVFVVDDDAIAAGMPEERRGAVFIHVPGKDSKLENDYLFALANGQFSAKRRDNAPDWLGGGKKLRMNHRSQKERARALSLVSRWLASSGRSYLTLTEVDVDDYGSELEEAGLDGGTIAFRQSTMLHCAQWAVWEGLRPPLKVSFYKTRATWGTGDRTGPAESIRIAVLRKQTPQRVDYIDPAVAAKICDSVRDPAYRIAIRLLFGSGLRPSEPGAVQDASMPQTGGSDGHPAKFAVVGKGSKKRHPEAEGPVLRDINHYRSSVRPARAEKCLRISGRPATSLLLNGKNGNPINYWGVYREFKKACSKYGINAKPQWARHSFACNYLADFATSQMQLAQTTGVTIAHGTLEQLLESARVELMVLMGHAHFSTSAIYLSRVRAAITYAATQGRHASLGVA